VLQGIVQLCRSLELGTVAEGVETAWQFERLRNIGTDECRGYHFARPLTCARWGAELSGLGAVVTSGPSAKTPGPPSG